MKFNWLLQVTVLTLVVYLSGCASPFSLKDDETLRELIYAYKKHENEREEKQKQRLQEEIKSLNVEKSGSHLFVTADLKKASITEVVRRVFDKVKVFDKSIRHRFDNVKPFGYITTRFEKKRLKEALNLILESNWLIAEQQDNVIVIKNDATEGQEVVYQEIVLENLDVETAKTLVESMFSSMGDDTTSNIARGIIPASNTIYLRGAKSKVSEVSQFLVKMDREIPHVTIEVLFVEFNAGELKELGAKLGKFQDGKYGGALNYKKRADMITFSKDLAETGVEYADYLTNFTAAVHILISNDKARLISRPYISTLSGQEATIDLTNDRYIIVDTGEGGSAQQNVQAGVKMKLTPVVLGEHKLQMTVDVEDSQFVTVTPLNVSIEKKKNKATTVMQVEDGQTIIIGGLTSNRRAEVNSGFPYLRKIPILDFFFADRSKEEIEKVVMIYVTPHIWKKPGIRPLIIKPYNMTIEKEAEKFYNEGKDKEGSNKEVPKK
jgi:type II secretory pathway component GspD/PulD (secretin)